MISRVAGMRRGHGWILAWALLGCVPNYHAEYRAAHPDWDGIFPSRSASLKETLAAIHAPSKGDENLWVQKLGIFRTDVTPWELLSLDDIRGGYQVSDEESYAIAATLRCISKIDMERYGFEATVWYLLPGNRLAAYENVVARFYLKRDAYVAALNRAKEALEAYHGAESGQESLLIMIDAYEGLGMTGLANDTRRVLQRNFGDEGQSASNVEN